MKKFFCLFVLIGFGAFSSAQKIESKLNISVQNLINQTPIENATVKIAYRDFSTNESGLISLKPLRSNKFFRSYQSNAEGKLELTFPLREENDIISIEVVSKGKESLLKSYVAISSEMEYHFYFKMTPAVPTLEEEQKIELLTSSFRIEKDQAKANDLIHSQFLAVPTSTTRNGCTFSVPDSVYVQNLVNGYNGSSTGSGFTGYIDFDDYVAGVVHGELGGITTNVDVKKAQAIAARTYSLNRHLSGLAVNIGQAYHDTPNSTAIQGAQQTSGEVILYNGVPIDAKYSARCNGDYTQHADAGTWAPYTNCNTTGTPIPYLISRPCSGHQSCGTTSETPCCNVTISTSGVSGYIYGHGVGLCQRGIEQWGEIHGLDYCEMLHKYYTGVCIANSNCADSTATLDCSNPVELTCGVSYSGPASTANSVVDSYGCNSWTETGPERIHSFTPNFDGPFTASLSNFSGDLDVYILGSCDPNDCLGTVSSDQATYSNGVNGETYYIIVDADDGSGSAYDLVIDCPTVSLQEQLAIDAVEIYPNPSTGIFQLNYNNANVDEVLVYDSKGKVMFKGIRPNLIDLRNYDKGLYFVKLMSSEKRFSIKKVIIN